MNRVVRAWLVWLMVIAMPAQGMAAASMLFCGPSHARMMLVLDADAATDQHAHGPVRAAAAHHGGHQAHAAADDAAPSAAGHVAQGNGAEASTLQHGQFNCSACAACCAMLALPARAVLPAAVTPAQPARTPGMVRVTSHQPDGLDRPPRTPLA